MRYCILCALCHAQKRPLRASIFDCNATIPLAPPPPHTPLKSLPKPLDNDATMRDDCIMTTSTASTESIIMRALDALIAHRADMTPIDIAHMIDDFDNDHDIITHALIDIIDNCTTALDSDIFNYIDRYID